MLDNFYWANLQSCDCLTVYYCLSLTKVKHEHNFESYLNIVTLPPAQHQYSHARKSNGIVGMAKGPTMPDLGDLWPSLTGSMAKSGRIYGQIKLQA